tara:strand:+ start:402 stop:524 length:123 start_codon:yes stop_codon:yes gene_type:complete
VRGDSSHGVLDASAAVAAAAGREPRELPALSTALSAAGAA